MKFYKRSRSLEENTIYAMLILYLYYYSYRYILKYNSESTSPTYSDTPSIFKWLKFVILIAIIVKYIIQSRRLKKIKVSNQNVVIALGIFLLILQGLIYCIIMPNYSYLKMLVVLSPILLFCGRNITIDYKCIEDILEIYFWFTVIYEIIQIICYILFKRLPALGYDTGHIIDVRFGGSWDDPNGFSVLLSFYFVYFFTKYRSVVKKIICLLVVSMLLVLTWSATGMVSCSASLIFFLLLTSTNKNNIEKRFIILLCLGMALIAVVALNKDMIVSNFSYYLKIKQGSIIDHVNSWKLPSLSILSFFGLYPIIEGREVGWLYLLLYGGIWEALAFVIPIIYSIRILLNKMKGNTNSDEKALYAGMITYIIGLLLSMFNLPLMYNFSNIGIASICIIVACTDTKRL